MARLADLHRRRAVAKKLRPSARAEHRYTMAVRGILRGVRQEALGWLAPKLEQLTRQDAPDGSGGAPPAVGRGRTDLSSRWTAEVERLAGEIAPKIVAPFDHLSTEVVRKNAQVARELGLDVRGQLGPHIQEFREWSQSLIKSAARDFGAQVAGVLDDPFTWGMRHEEIAALLKERADVSDSRAKLIARDQTQKLNASINSYRQRSAGVTSYEWSTSNDERVRDTHAANEGKVFQWGNPPPETGDPGDDVQCRCVAVPVIPELEDDDATTGPSGGPSEEGGGGSGNKGKP